MPKITSELIDAIREWLGPEGLAFFRGLKERYGRVDPLLKIYTASHGDFHGAGPPLPWPVHFREGMKVRNKMRELTDYSWTAHEYDDHWVEVVEQVMLL